LATLVELGILDSEIEVELPNGGDKSHVFKYLNDIPNRINGVIVLPEYLRVNFFANTDSRS